LRPAGGNAQLTNFIFLQFIADLFDFPGNSFIPLTHPRKLVHAHPDPSSPNMYSLYLFVLFLFKGKLL